MTGPRWIGRAELARTLEVSRHTINSWSIRQNWNTRPAVGPTGRELQVEIASLPERIKAKLIQAQTCPIYNNDTKPGSLAKIDKLPDPVMRLALAKSQAIKLYLKEIQAAGYGQKMAAAQRFESAYNRGSLAPDLTSLTGPTTWRSLERWRNQFEQGGLLALADRRGRPKGAALDMEIKRFVEDCLYTQPLVTAQKIHRFVLFRFKGRLLPSDRTLRRYAAQFKAQHKAQLLFLRQPSVFKRWYQISLGRADADLTEPNQRWEVDSTRADIMTADGKRCTVIGIKDVWTRRPMVDVFKKGGGHNINQLFFSTIRKWGVPRQIITDRGKDYLSTQVQCLFADLGIDAPEIPGYAPELKPHAEIGFSLMAQDLLLVLTGYTSNKLADRPEIISTKYTLAELKELTAKWVIDYEHNHTVSTIGATPMQRWNQALEAGWRPDTVDEAALRILLKPPVERGITQSRIRFENGDYTAEELDWLEPSSKVWVRPDPDDASILYVFDAEKNFICIAQDITRLNLTTEQLAQRKKRWWKLRRMERKAAQARAVALNMDAIQEALLDDAVANAPADAPLPKPNISLPEIEAAAEALAEKQAETGLADMASLEELEAQRPRQSRRLEVVGKPAGGEEPLPRPDFFLDHEHRYRWTRKRQAAGLEVNHEDLDVATEFEASGQYKMMSPAYWERDAQILELAM